MIHNARSDWSALKQWFILWCNGLTDSEFRKLWPCPKWHINLRGLPLSPHFRDVMPLWLSGRSLLRSSHQRRLARSAYWGCIMAAKGALASTLLNTKMKNGTPYGLVDLTDTRQTVAIFSPQDRKCTWSVPFGTGPMTKNVCWRAFFLWLRWDKEKMTIRSINDNYDYINMQFHWWKKMRLKCIQKNKNFTKNLFYFCQKKETKYCGLLYMPLLRELSCVRLPDITEGLLG